MILGSEEIKKLLPHRDPFLFLDKCEIIKLGEKGIGYRKFLPDEYFFKGHFPNQPIVPGVIIVETLAQTAGVVVSKTFDDSKNKSVLFTSISSSKFRKPVYPNDEISFEVEIQNKFKSVYKFCGIAKNTSNIVCEASFSAMIVDKSSEEIL
tara:strand:+ start:638 stop:1090 length:453 start_codon:yes stop_codon:yes gene_type:complete